MQVARSLDECHLLVALYRTADSFILYYRFVVPYCNPLPNYTSCGTLLQRCQQLNDASLGRVARLAWSVCRTKFGARFRTAKRNTKLCEFLKKWQDMHRLSRKYLRNAAKRQLLSSLYSDSPLDFQQNSWFILAHVVMSDLANLLARCKKHYRAYAATLQIHAL